MTIVFPASSEQCQIETSYTGGHFLCKFHGSCWPNRDAQSCPAGAIYRLYEGKLLNVQMMNGEVKPIRNLTLINKP